MSFLSLVHVGAAFVPGGSRALLPPTACQQLTMLQTPPYRIVKGRRVYQDGVKEPVARNFQGSCVEEPIDPKAGAVAFAAAAILAYFGFQTEFNRREGPTVGRRRAVTWLALQSGAAFSLGPQLTNPCSPVNDKYRNK